MRFRMRVEVGLEVLVDITKFYDKGKANYNLRN